MQVDFWTKIILLIVVLHFVVGFAYLIYKLLPKKGDRKESIDVEEE